MAQRRVGVHISLAMGVTGSTYATQLHEYEVALSEWEETCAAMAAEEAAATYDASMGTCGLTAYVLQQCVGATLELPLRYVWHVGCAAACCSVTPCALAARECGDARWVPAAQALVAHHSAHVQLYNGLCTFLCENVAVHPCAPIDLYKPDVTLARPPRPVRPVHPCACECTATSACCGGGGDGPGAFACDCATAEQLLLRRVRVMLCVLALADCRESCHPSSCCGPWSPCGCSGEREDERLGRWKAEEDAKRAARTAAFHVQRAETPGRYNFTRAPLTGHVTASIQRDANAAIDSFAASPVHAEPAEPQADLADTSATYNKMER